MESIKGVFKRSIFKTDNGYTVGLLRVKESSDKQYEQRTITFTGYFHELTEEETYLFHGDFTEHDKYGKQFNVESYEKPLPEEKDSIVEFLSSGLFKGIGEKTAQKIVDVLGKDTLTVILENPENLLLIPKITKKQVDSLHEQLVSYQASYEIVLKMNDLGFSTKDSMLIYNKYKTKTLDIIQENFYQVYYDEVQIPFKKLDIIARNNNIELLDKKRIEAYIIYALTEVSNTLGHSYLTLDELLNYTKRALGIMTSDDILIEPLENLLKDMKIILEDGKYYLKNMYDAETNIVRRVCYLTRKEDNLNKKLEKEIINLEKDLDIFYNEEQRNAVYSSYTKNFLVITGGPGTGKTTILKGIVNLYREINKYRLDDLSKKVALLAPTGRASKRISESVGLTASTIHRFLKWNKENNKFQINEHHKSDVELVIIDEASMVDVYLFDSLLKGLKLDTKIILVGDDNQLPSVGPGQVLKDILDSDTTNVIKLTELYRQSKESKIITLAYDINNDEVSTDVFNKKDAHFIPCIPQMIKDNILDISKKNIKNDYKNFQILVPMYKGINGIDEINLACQELFNKKSPKKNEISINNIVFRENDKVIQLTNMPDDNVFNGDIGVIEQIKVSPKKEITIDFDGNEVVYTPSDFSNFKHAYAISIHKSQGSEFDTVVIPLSKSYGKMLYRKLIYTGVTRAKKELYLIGDIDSLFIASHNNIADIRHTTIKDKLIEKM